MAWTAVIYLTVPFAIEIRRFALEHLGGPEAFLWIVMAGVVALFVVLIRIVYRSPRQASSRGVAWLLLIAAILLYNAWQRRDRPVEALHYLEYGLLGLFLFRALRFRIPDVLIYPCVILIGGLLGTIDEIIQWVTPGRLWDWRDIGFNISAVALMQAAVLLGIRPDGIDRRPAARSIQAGCRLALVFIVLAILCLANTPERADRYTTRIPALHSLYRNPSTMSEYGHLYRDPAIGAFKSRLSPEALHKIDSERAGEAARALDEFRNPRLYDACLEAYPAHVEPFIHEARVHLWSMTHHLGILWTNRWDEPMRDDLNPARVRKHATSCYKEYQIMSIYFSNTMQRSHYAPYPSQLNTLKAHADPSPSYRSKVSRYVITALPELAFYMLLMPLAMVAIGIDLWLQLKS